MQPMSSQNRRSRIVILIIAVFLVLAIVSDNRNQAMTNTQITTQTENLTELQKDSVVERELKGDAAHSYTITMAANQYLQAEVEQLGIDVVASVYGPDNQKIYEIDSPNGTVGPEPIYLITESAGPYRLEVRSLEKEVKPGKYQAKITALRKPDEKDRARVKAFKLKSEAELISNERKPEIVNQLIAKYQEAIALFHSADEPVNEADFIFNLASIHFDRDDYGNSEKFYQQALALYEKVLGSEHAEVATTLNNLAMVYNKKGDYDKSVLLHQRALAIREKTLGPENASVANTLNNLATVYSEKGDYGKSELLHQRALAIREKVYGPESAEVAQSLNNLSSLYFNKSELGKAEIVIQRAIPIYEKVYGPVHPLVATALNNLAVIYNYKSSYDKAISLHQRALAILEKTSGPETADIANTLTSLSVNYIDKSDYGKAESFNQRALAICEKVYGPVHPLVATALNNMAMLYVGKGDYERAVSFHQRALAIREKVYGPEHSMVGLSLNGLAAAYFNQGDYDKAEPLYQRSLAVNEKVFGTDHLLVALALNNLAVLYKGKDDPVRAESLYQRALAIYQKVVGPEHPLIANNLDNMASLYRDVGDYGKAEPLYQRSLVMREKIFGPENTLVADTLNELATLYRKKGDIEQTINYKERADETREQVLVKNLIPGSEKEKLTYLNLTANELNKTLSIHLQSASNDKRATRLALAGILRRKGRALDAMTDSIAILRNRANKEDQVLLDQLAETRAQYATKTLKGPGKEGLAQYQTNLKALDQQIEILEKQVSSRSAEFSAKSQPITLMAIQAAIPDQAVLVEFASYRQVDAQNRSGGRRYAAYLLTNTGEPLFADLGAAEPIDQAIAELRKVLPDKQSDIEKAVKPTARALDELVMRPVRALLGNKRRLLISPDGALNLIPFDALVDEKDKYLVENYEISYLTSGRDLLRLQVKSEPKQDSLIFANPTFNNRVIPIANQPVENSEKDRGVDFSRLKFSPLLGSAQEAKEIAGVLTKVTVYQREDANEQNLKQATAPLLLHIATHGFFLPETVDNDATQSTNNGKNGTINLVNPMLRSGLAFAGANQRSTNDGNDGILTALEVSGLNLFGTKLVVLSACNTGVGEVKNGDGVYGLRRALVLAGAESQLISLWPISDLGTRDLMISYYKNLNARMGRSAALRAVQLEMLADNKRMHPFFWASFIQSGEWANLDGKR